MKELIKITTNENGQCVSARELHEKLEVTERFQQWFDKRVAKYNFVEGEDYVGCKNFYTANQYGAIAERQDYAITLDMAKELSMLQNNDLGRQFRKYFIECEKKLKEISSKPKQIDYSVDDQIKLLTLTSELLKLNDSSKLQLATKIYEDYGVPTTYLPNYTSSKGILKSATTLLKQYNVDLSAKAFNLIMLSKGYLEEKERPSSKGETKKFKSLVAVEYGENQVSPNNPRETQPMYYEDKFEELLRKLGVLE